MGGALSWRRVEGGAGVGACPAPPGFRPLPPLGPRFPPGPPPAPRRSPARTSELRKLAGLSLRWRGARAGPWRAAGERCALCPRGRPHRPAGALGKDRSASRRSCQGAGGRQPGGGRGGAREAGPLPARAGTGQGSPWGPEPPGRAGRGRREARAARGRSRGPLPYPSALGAAPSDRTSNPSP